MQPNYPRPIVPVDHVEPAPRRVRAVLAGQVVIDTLRAKYVWEHPAFPQYYVPLADVAPGVLVDEDHEQRLKRGTARRQTLRVGDTERPGAARVYGADAIEGLVDTVRFEWAALDAWYEEDERVFVHPRNPYARVDALRSTRHVRVSIDDVVLADSAAPVMLFETGLPTRYYFDRTAVRFEHLEPTQTQTSCPYKGTTSGYWSARVGDSVRPDVAWTYDFPTAAMLPIAGLIAFYNEKVDIAIDGVRLDPPITPFS
jgi:uncharacterized protein (DUF427 family)